MHRVIRKRVRHKEDGLDLAIDFNADIAINVGRSRPATESEAPAPEDDREPEAEPPEEGTDR